MIAFSRQPRSRVPARPRPTVKPCSGLLVDAILRGKIAPATLAALKEAAERGECKLFLVVGADGAKTLSAEFALP